MPSLYLACGGGFVHTKGSSWGVVLYSGVKHHLDSLDVSLEEMEESWVFGGRLGGRVVWDEGNLNWALKVENAGYEWQSSGDVAMNFFKPFDWNYGGSLRLEYITPFDLVVVPSVNGNWSEGSYSWVMLIGDRDTVDVGVSGRGIDGKVGGIYRPYEGAGVVFEVGGFWSDTTVDSVNVVRTSSVYGGGVGFGVEFVVASFMELRIGCKGIFGVEGDEYVVEDVYRTSSVSDFQWVTPGFGVSFYVGDFSFDLAINPDWISAFAPYSDSHNSATLLSEIGIRAIFRGF